MPKRLQVLIDEDEYLEIQEAARKQGMNVSKWIRSVLRKEIAYRPRSAEAKLRAIGDASRHSYPTADIEAMLREIASMPAQESSVWAEPRAER